MSESAASEASSTGQRVSFMNGVMSRLSRIERFDPRSSAALLKLRRSTMRVKARMTSINYTTFSNYDVRLWLIIRQERRCIVILSTGDHRRPTQGEAS